MEIIYRVYEVRRKEDESYSSHCCSQDDTMLDQAVLCCNSREHFKEIMRDMYSPKKISFRNSKSLKDGDIYVVIISEDCYDAKKYVEVSDFVCDCCGKPFKRNEKLVSKINLNWLKTACPQKYEVDEKKLIGMNFCSYKCRDKMQNDLEKEYREYAEKNNIVTDEYWVGRDSFSHESGYIYMITKRSTKEFYVGQTKYVPVFRWGQHLKTERFPLENIDDYIFEVLEVCKNSSETLNQREAYWINKKRDENPSLSLNIQIPKEEPFSLLDILKEDEKDKEEK